MLQLQATFVILEHAPVDAVGFNAGLSSSTARSCKVCWQGLGTAPSPAPPSGLPEAAVQPFGTGGGALNELDVKSRNITGAKPNATDSGIPCYSLLAQWHRLSHITVILVSSTYSSISGSPQHHFHFHYLVNEAVNDAVERGALQVQGCTPLAYGRAAQDRELEVCLCRLQFKF